MPMARLDHVALWTDDIERLALFDGRYFGAKAGERYLNASKGFEARFVTFEGGARLEIMRTTSLHPVSHAPGTQRMGLTHLGDGYYESVVLDPTGIGWRSPLRGSLTC